MHFPDLRWNQDQIKIHNDACVYWEAGKDDLSKEVFEVKAT